MNSEGSTRQEPASPDRMDSSAVSNYRELSFFAILAGSTSLIPLPFIDDWAHSWVRRQLIRSQYQQRPLTRVQEKLLLSRLEKTRTQRGCLGNSLVLMIVAPIRVFLYVVGRLFRKIFFFLAVKEAVDRAAEAFQEGFLLSLSSRCCSLQASPQLDEDQKVLQLSFAIEETMRQTSASPLRRLIRKVFRGSYGLLFKAAAEFRTLRRKVDEGAVPADDPAPEEFMKQEEEELKDLAGDLAAALPVERAYLDSLAAQFENFARRRSLFS